MTFCVVIESKINTTVCPLEKGSCYWQHRKDRSCCYTDQDLSPEEFSTLVGLEKKPLMSLTEFRAQLKTALL